MLRITLDPKAEKTLGNIGRFILRVAPAALLLTQHGWMKLHGYSSMANQFPDPLGVSSHVSLALAVFAEFFCSALVILGLWTRLALIPMIITMAVAVLIVHASDPMAKKEFALLYLIPFVASFLVGAGDWTLGRFFKK